MDRAFMCAGHKIFILYIVPIYGHCLNCCLILFESVIIGHKCFTIDNKAT